MLFCTLKREDWSTSYRGDKQHEKRTDYYDKQQTDGGEQMQRVNIIKTQYLELSEYSELHEIYKKHWQLGAGMVR